MSPASTAILLLIPALLCAVAQTTATPLMVELTLIQGAIEKGAVCLDGTAPAYHIHRGVGSGANSWLLSFEAGAWCSTLWECSTFQNERRGSSTHMKLSVEFPGILSNDPSQNPDFFNWNRVLLRYCDGASFSGHPDNEPNNGTKSYFRGQKIFDAFMDELSALGLSNAKEALLTGCSSGGLATLLHCDSFRGSLPQDATVKCLSDAGFFINFKDIVGNPSIENLFRDVVHLQGVASSLNKDCLSKVESHKCFFPQEFIRYVKTPIFLLNPSFDAYQIYEHLVPEALYPKVNWTACKDSKLRNCTPEQDEVLQGYHDKFVKIVSELQLNKEAGMFINSCLTHCQSYSGDEWHSPTSPRMNNRTIAESVGDWFFNRGAAKYIDCPSTPCKSACKS